MTRQRAGFSLLEVMVALGILIVSLVILVETQSNAAVMTTFAEEVIVGTDLATAKVNEALLRVEEEGFQVSQIHEQGDFNDFGDDANSLEFGDELERFHWEYWISEVDVELAGDIAGMAAELDGKGLFGGGEGGGLDMGGAGDMASGALGAVGLGPGAITEMLGPYIREVRVRVWWGDDADKAEELGDEVIITAHVVNPMGALAMSQPGGLPQ